MVKGVVSKMRVSRFLNVKGESVCSLVLADETTEAIAWFDSMVEKYGKDAVMTWNLCHQITTTNE